MSVVQRCPNCGTTQAAAGDCEACHEARVQYFCTNHERGVWLAGPTCPQCEERLPPPSPSPTPLPSHVRTAERRSRAPAPPRARPVDELDLTDVSTPPAFWERLSRGALVARPSTSSGHAGGWLKRLLLRLALIAVILVAGLVGVVYMLMRSLH